MSTRMRLLFFTNGLLKRAADTLWFVGFEASGYANRRLDVLEQMRKDGRT